MSKRIITEDEDLGVSRNQAPSNTPRSPSSASGPSSVGNTSVGNTSVKPEPGSSDEGDQVLSQLREKVIDWARKFIAYLCHGRRVN